MNMDWTSNGSFSQFMSRDMESFASKKGGTHQHCSARVGVLFNLYQEKDRVVVVPKTKGMPTAPHTPAPVEPSQPVQTAPTLVSLVSVSIFSWMFFFHEECLWGHDCCSLTQWNWRTMPLMKVPILTCKPWIWRTISGRPLSTWDVPSALFPSPMKCQNLKNQRRRRGMFWCSKRKNSSRFELVILFCCSCPVSKFVLHSQYIIIIVVA